MPRTLTVYLVHVPKTAGSAIKELLKTRATTSERFEGWKLGTHDGNTVHFIAKGHCPAFRFPTGALKVATIRDPVDRFLSAYRFVREGGSQHPNQGAVGQARAWAPALQRYKTFAAFWKDKPFVTELMGPKGHTHFRPLDYWVTSDRSRKESAYWKTPQPPRTLDVDFVIRQTHVDEDFRRLCECLNIDAPDVPIAKFNVTGDQSGISAALRKQVATTFATDVTLYERLVEAHILDKQAAHVRRVVALHTARGPAVGRTPPWTPRHQRKRGRRTRRNRTRP